MNWDSDHYATPPSWQILYLVFLAQTFWCLGPVFNNTSLPPGVNFDFRNFEVNYGGWVWGNVIILKIFAKNGVFMYTK
jgi:hypothetical protein